MLKLGFDGTEVTPKWGNISVSKTGMDYRGELPIGNILSKRIG